MSVISIDKHDFSDVSNAIEPFNLLADHYGQDLAVKQLQLEHEAYTEGERRFIKNLERQTERGELADNQVAKPLMQTLVPKIAQAVREWHEGPDGKLSTSRPSVAFTMLSTEEKAVKDRSLRISCESAAVIILKVILSKLVKPEGVPITPMASAIGRTLEDEIRFGRIRDKERAHFKKAIAENLNKRAGASYKKAYMQAVETSMLEQGQLEDAWGTWSPTEAVHVGIKMLEIVIQSTQLVELKRYGAGNAATDVEMVHLSDFWVKKMAQRGFSLAGIAPVYQPCVVPPKPWTGVVGGGYWAKGRRPLPLIRLGSKSAVARYEDVYMPEVYDAVNIIQNTPWKVNKKVLDVALQLPTDCRVTDEHAKYALRVAASKLGFQKKVAHMPKQPFITPLTVWLQTDLYYNRIRQAFTSEAAHEFFNVDYLVKMLDDHKSADFSTVEGRGKLKMMRIWNIYCFLTWYEVFFGKSSEKLAPKTRVA